MPAAVAGVEHHTAVHPVEALRGPGADRPGGDGAGPGPPAGDGSPARDPTTGLLELLDPLGTGAHLGRCTPQVLHRWLVAVHGSILTCRPFHRTHGTSRSSFRCGGAH